ncbi:MAG: TonB-dependent receptor, partial [Gammaproteobacteria bacterium]|nr:TonB-dependent receptor [Gammaproteobacteria bacterium]
VHRSRLLLDQDLAARSASLGRIYTDLGFNQSANREAVNSLQLDPANYSAHRLLADSFRGSQRNQITRASELFQAQLLQPYSSAPLQAELSRSQASISEGASPTDPGFNEYQPLFIRDRVSSNLSHIRGDLNTSGTQLQISSLRKGIGISAGFNDYTSDGVRTNNDFFHETSTLLFQGSTSTHKNLLLEFRQEIFNHGDITQSLIPENYSEFERNRSNSESIRVATRIRKGRNTWLFHAYNKEEVGSYRDSQIAPGSPFDVLLDISSDYDSSTKAIETQIVSQFSNGFTKTGFFLSQVISDYTVLTAGTFIAPFTIPSFKSIDDSITEEGNHLTPYAYYVSPANRVFLFEMGASYDDYWRNKQIQHKLTKTTSLEYEQHQQLNPKLGLSWNIGNNVTLRSSYFRTLKRALSNNVTLEPTVFNGAVQFQDDITLVDNKNSTVSLDYKASDDFSAGADFLHQRRSMPINDTRQRWENRVAHIYANWIAGRSLTIVASERHQYENRYGETLGAQFPRTLETTSQQMGIRYFPHSSWSLKLSFNHISQLGFFVKKGDTTDTANIIHQQRFMPVDVESNLKIGRNLRLTLGARNLFNEGFRYQQGMYPPIESVQNEFIPTRFIYGKLDLSL